MGVRLGKPIKWSGGEYGYINSWQHVECTRIPQEDRKLFKAERDIYGFNDLQSCDKKYVKKEIVSKVIPEKLLPIDPSDPCFLKKQDLHRRKPPPELNASLLPYQEEGFDWMVKREESDDCGGILADEMGMGKTIQAISLIVNDIVQEKKYPSSKKGGENTMPTLIICPTSSMLQWRDEIERFTISGSVKVLVYYRNRKAI